MYIYAYMYLYVYVRALGRPARMRSSASWWEFASQLLSRLNSSVAPRLLDARIQIRMRSPACFCAQTS